MTEDVKSRSLLTYTNRIWFLDSAGNMVFLARISDTGKTVLVNKRNISPAYNRLRDALIFEFLNNFYDPSLAEDSWSDKFSKIELVL